MLIMFGWIICMMSGILCPYLTIANIINIYNTYKLYYYLLLMYHPNYWYIMPSHLETVGRATACPGGLSTLPGVSPEQTS